MFRRARTLLCSLALAAASLRGRAQTAAAPNTLPHLERRGQATQLVVDASPFLILGGELHNSSSSSLAYLQPIWPQLAATHLNTALLPVAWETIEPTEGHFDFTLVDGLLAGARAHHLKLVLLWFGTWKNTFSSYDPAWVKRDEQRFPRVETSDGRGTERLSPFSQAAWEADARAFAALMAHLRSVDGTDHTVLMMQVENEVGVLPQSRDHSPVAEAAFHAPVPARLLAYIAQHRATLDPAFRSAWETAGAKTSGTWQQVFGDAPLTDDFFMAWQYATYIQHVTAAGKAQYPLPMYANAALVRPNYEPGQYNSGGPLPHSTDIYRAGAPALDFLSPDIYFNEFALWAGLYTRPGNPLFIPEAQPGTNGAANALYAFGQCAAIGFSVFGIDDQNNAPLDLAGVTNPAEHPDNTAVGDTYAELADLAPLLLRAQADGKATAAVLEGEAQRAARVRAGDFLANVARAGGPAEAGARVGVLLLQTAPDEFLVVGAGDAQVTFTTDRPGPPVVGLLSVDEEFFQNGNWTPGRRLNGDEDSQRQSLRLYASDRARGRIYRIRLYRYR